mgnify:FL=1
MPFTIHAFDKNSSASHSKSYNPQTKEEFDKCVKEFDEEVNQIFYKWYFEFDTVDATPEQEQWCDEEENKTF